MTADFSVMIKNGHSFFFEWWYILVAFVSVILVESFIFSKFFALI